jgi:hypothetical protein
MTVYVLAKFSSNNCIGFEVVKTHSLPLGPGR